MAAFAALLAVFDLSRRPLVTFLLLGVSFLSYFWALRRLQRTAGASLVLGVAVVLRLLLLPLPPTLSDDTLRYVWDGRVAAAGFNPYRLAPESSALTALRDPLWEKMPHKDVPSVYPPLALAVFTVASRTPHPLMGVKILLASAELLGCWLLIRLAAALGLAPGRAAWYCWHPLAVVEVAGMGHVDGLLVACQVAAVYFLARGRPARAGVAAAAGVLAKLVPLAAVPVWTRLARRRALFLGVALGVVLAASLPLLLALGAAPPGLVKYGVSWEFNGALFEPLWRSFDAVGLDLTVKSGLDLLKTWTGRHQLWNRFYPFVYPQLLAKVALLGLFAVLFVGVWRGAARCDPPGARAVAATGRLMGAVAVCSATFFPWYLLWVLPWAALARHRAWLAVSVAMPLAYLPQLTGWPLFPWFWLAVWAPFFVLLRSSSWSID